MHEVEAKAILSAQNGMNLYRGCTHGCIYCDSRSLIYGMEHAFEDVEVKKNAPELLEQALSRKRKKCMIGTGAMSDPYLPLEKEALLTRRCLEILERRGFGLSILTKSREILRDLSLLEAIHRRAKCVAQMTITTLDDGLCRVVEPRVTPTSGRLEALQALGERRIPTIVWLSPIFPWINDTEENLRGILRACKEAGVYGVLCFGMGMTLREGNREYFYQKLEERFPGLKRRYQSRYQNSYILESPNSRKLSAVFDAECERLGLIHDNDRLFHFMRSIDPPGEQLSLFSGPIDFVQ